MGNSKRIQEQIWTGAVAATRLPSSHPAAGWLLLPALNNMIDITTTRTMALQMHPPASFMRFFLDWASSARFWPAIGWRPDSTGVGCTFSASR